MTLDGDDQVEGPRSAVRFGLRVDGVVGKERGLAPYAAGGAEEGEMSAAGDLGEGNRRVDVAAELVGDLLYGPAGARLLDPYAACQQRDLRHLTEGGTQDVPHQ